MRCQLDNLQWMEEEELGAGRAHGRMRDEGRGASPTRVRRYTVNTVKTAATQHVENSTRKNIKSLKVAEIKHDALYELLSFFILKHFKQFKKEIMKERKRKRGSRHCLLEN